MSEATKFIASLLGAQTGSAQYMKLKPSSELFAGGTEQWLFSFVDAYMSKYGQLPGPELLKEESNKAGVFVPLPTEVDGAPGFYFDKLIERAKFNSIKSGALAVQDHLNSGNTSAAEKVISDLAFELLRSGKKTQIVDYAQEGGAMVLSEVKKKLLLGDDYGIQFGWPYLDAMTGGLMGGDVVSMVGRPASGKTWMVLYVALNAWLHGKVVLFVSMEMRPLLLMQRIAALDTSIPVGHFKHATLGTIHKKHMTDVFKGNKEKQPFWVVDGALSATPNDLSLYARQLGADVVVVDGAYLMKSANPKLQRWERVTENAERIKGDIAEALDIPTIISYQFNREATKKKVGAPGVEDIAYTDAIGQLSSVVLGLMQEDNITTVLSRDLDVLKGRSGE
jgi:replicative DNA helicase